MTRTLLTAALCLGLLTSPAAANPPGTGPASPADKRIARKLPHRIDHGALGRDVAVRVVDAASGREVFGHRDHHRLAGASNTKLITALVALQALGPNHRAATVVRRVGTHRIALVGGGDSLLSSGNVNALARRTARNLRREGVRRVGVQIDASLYSWRGPGFGWASYEVGGNIGKVQPLNMNDARTADGPGYVGRYYIGRLRAYGIRARSAGRGPSSEQAPVEARFRGHTVKRIARAALLPSDSDHAEALGRLVAVGLGYPGTYRGWWRAAKSVLNQIGVRHKGIRLHDSAGLSRRNRITATFVTQLLVASMERPRMHVLLRQRRLPTAGRTGTLAPQYGRFVGPAQCARGKVFAKTGTITGVVALSGYARGADGWKVFSILVNHRPGVDVLRSRQALDRIAATVTGCW